MKRSDLPHFVSKLTFRCRPLELQHTTFLWSEATVCLFLCAYYLFFGKPADINDYWIKHIRVIQWRLLDAVSSMCSLSVLLSTMETSRTTQNSPSGSPLTIVRNIHIRVPHILAVTTIREWRLFHLELLMMRQQFEGSYYLRVASIWGRIPFEGGIYLRADSIWGWCLIWGWLLHLFEEATYYLRAGSIREQLLFKGGYYLKRTTIRGQCLFEASI